MIFIGIDPGKNGGLVAINGKQLRVTPMPDDEYGVWAWFSEIIEEHDPTDCVACIEEAHAYPGQGVCSMFQFGMGYGGLKMALSVSGIPFSIIKPKKWMGELGLLTTKKLTYRERKKRNHQRVRQLFPKLNVEEEVADAILIAEYTRRISK